MRSRNRGINDSFSFSTGWFWSSFLIFHLQVVVHSSSTPYLPAPLGCCYWLSCLQFFQHFSVILDGSIKAASKVVCTCKKSYSGAKRRKKTCSHQDLYLIYGLSIFSLHLCIATISDRLHFFSIFSQKSSFIWVKCHLFVFFAAPPPGSPIK